MLLFSCLILVVWSDIPKLIIQTGPNKPVSDFKGFPEQLKKINPSFEYTYYDDAAALDFVAKHFPDSDLLAVYQDPRLKVVMKADLFRLAAISVLGGFYFDMDVYAYRNLDPLLSHRAVFPKEWWRNNGEYEDRHGTLPEDDEDHWQMGNYAFAAEPGHPLVQNALKEAVKRANDLLNTKLSEDLETLEDFDVLKTTGPYMLSEVYHKGRKEGQYGDVYFMMGGNEIPLYPKSRGGPTWHKFGKYGEHAITHTWVRRKLATETELAEILWKANTDKKKDISWARGVIKELKARFGELTISESNENYKADSKKEKAEDQESDKAEDKPANSKVEEKNDGEKKKGDKESEKGKDKPADSKVEEKNDGGKKKGDKTMLDEGEKKEDKKNAKELEKKLSEAHELAKAEGFEVKPKITSDDLEWAQNVLQRNFVRATDNGMEIALGGAEYQVSGANSAGALLASKQKKSSIRDRREVTFGTRVFIFGGLLIAIGILGYVWNSKAAMHVDELNPLLGDYPEEDQFQ